MIIENTAALQFFMTEDIYLTKADRDNLETVVSEPSVIDETPAVVVKIQAETKALNFDYLGKNAKRFLIVCSYAGINYMDEKHLEALKSAMQRKELALDDVAILNIARYTAATADELHSFFKPQRLLLLGAPSLLGGWDKLGLNVLIDLNGVKALYTYSFTEMMGDRDKTKAFWEQMKVL